MVDFGTDLSHDTWRASAKRSWMRRGKLWALGAVLCLGLLFGESVSALAIEAFEQVTGAYLVLWIDSAGAALGCF